VGVLFRLGVRRAMAHALTSYQRDMMLRLKDSLFASKTGTAFKEEEEVRFGRS
jgi:hypothetical protein